METLTHVERDGFHFFIPGDIDFPEKASDLILWQRAHLIVNTQADDPSGRIAKNRYPVG